MAQLRTFVTIAEHKHFGTAAHRLNISQPSLSQALVALETGLGVQLIERSTRKVIVTPTGESLLPYAKETLKAADSFLAQAHQTNGTITGPITLGVIPTIAPYLLPELMKQLAVEYPDLKLTIVEDQTEHLIQQLKDGQIECAVLALPTHTPGITEIPLYDENFKIIVSEDHALAGSNNVKLNQLKDLDLLLLDDGHCLRDQVVDLCRKADFDPTHTPFASTRAASITTVVQLVSAGMGSTLVPESAVKVETSRPGVAIANFDEKVTAKRQVGLVHRSSTGPENSYALLGKIIADSFANVIAT